MSITQATNLAFMQHQLENVDSIIAEPIVDYTWSRDIKVRNLDLADEVSSFLRSDFAFAGTTGASDIPWVAQDTNTFTGVNITMEKISSPMYLAGREISYSELELAKAQKLGINLDTQKVNALQVSYQLSINQMVYLGAECKDTSNYKSRGLLNSDHIDGVTKVDSTVDFMTETNIDLIVDTFNNWLIAIWEKSGTTMCPNTILLPPSVFARLASLKYSSNAERTALDYLKEKCIAYAVNGSAPDFRPVMYARNAGADGGARITAYFNNERYVRYCLAPIRRYQTEVHGMRYSTPYIWGLGNIEIIYPETIGYLDKVDATSAAMSMPAGAQTMSMKSAPSDGSPSASGTASASTSTSSGKTSSTTK